MAVVSASFGENVKIISVAGELQVKYRPYA